MDFRIIEYKEILELLKLYDGLVMVHPDYDTGYNPLDCYRENLRRFVFVLRIYEKQLFKVPSPPNPYHPHIKGIDEYLKGAHIVGYGYLNSEVKKISKKLKKRPEDISLAFGGIYAPCCVWDYASSICETVETNFPGKKPSLVAKTPIKKGAVLDELI